jgi:hypothetical protein
MVERIRGIAWIFAGEHPPKYHGLTHSVTRHRVTMH